MASQLLKRARSTHEAPLLKHGERLCRDEFERRYEAIPESIKAELIEGVVHMSSFAITSTESLI